MNEWDLTKIVDLLISDPKKRTPLFPYEREVRLFQFQTWIYFPTRPDIVRMAGRIIATMCLQRIAAGMSIMDVRDPVERSSPSEAFEKLLEQEDYRDLFDEVIGEYGGWTALLDTFTPEEFDQVVRGRIQSARTVAKMIDYRFRYLQHGGKDPKLANIRHSEFFCWNDPKDKVSWKTIRQRWQLNRDNAVFLYVSEKFGFAPTQIGAMLFLPRLNRDAYDRRRIRMFFGYASYISDKFFEVHMNLSHGDIPAAVKPLKPKTKRLNAEELERMSSYKAQKDEMRDS